MIDLIRFWGWIINFQYVEPSHFYINGWKSLIADIIYFDYHGGLSDKILEQD